MTGAIAAAGPTARVRTEHETRPGEKQGSPVNLASRSGVLDKLSVTAEMSTTKCSDADLEVRSGGRKQREGTSANKNVRRKGRLDLCVCVCVATGLLLCVNGSVEKGGFEQQNKLMEAVGT